MVKQSLSIPLANVVESQVHPVVNKDPHRPAFHHSYSVPLELNKSLSIPRQSTLKSYTKWSPSEHGATLVWKDVCVYSTRKEQEGPQIKRLISNVSGAILPGTLVALMGASGAGKSTLMSALAYRTLRKSKN